MQGLLSVMILLSGALARAEPSEKYIQSHAQCFTGFKISPALIRSTSPMKMILLGESHGTQEIPAYAFEYVKKMSKIHSLAFGMEYPREIQSSVDLFLKTGDESILAALRFFKDPNYHSGRGSRSVVEALKGLRKFPKIKVFGFDIDETDASPDRDTKMARNVLDFYHKFKRRKIIIYSGNIHSRLTDGYPGNPTHKNMGAEILRLSGNLFSLKNSRNINVVNNQGTAWQCRNDATQKITCGDYSLGPDRSSYAAAVSCDRYLLEEPDLNSGHFFSIFFRNVTASPPQF